MTFDPRSRKMLATVDNFIKGPTVAMSRDLGRTWKEGKKPPRFPKSSDWSVKQVWHIEPGVEEEPGVVYCGVDPAALFRSEDGGETWALNQGLYNQETRKKWNPGAGGLCLHSILVDPRDPKTMHVAISSVGILKTRDGGESWSFKNKNLRADFLPNKYPEYGQCPHHLVRHPSRPDVIYQQNHCGQYRSDDNGETWKEMVGQPALALRLPHRGRLQRPQEGLRRPGGVRGGAPPARRQVPRLGLRRRGEEVVGAERAASRKRSFYNVYREGMDTDEEDPSGVYVGTGTGQLYFSRDGARSGPSSPTASRRSSRSARPAPRGRAPERGLTQAAPRKERA